MGRESVFLSQVIPFTEQKKEYLLYENHQSGLISFASPYPSDALLHHSAESMKNIVTLYSPINCEYHHTPAFYQIRVSKMGIVG